MRPREIVARWVDFNQLHEFIVKARRVGEQDVPVAPVTDPKVRCISLDKFHLCRGTSTCGVQQGAAFLPPRLGNLQRGHVEPFEDLHPAGEIEGVKQSGGDGWLSSAGPNIVEFSWKGGGTTEREGRES